MQLMEAASRLFRDRDGAYRGAVAIAILELDSDSAAALAVLLDKQQEDALEAALERRAAAETRAAAERVAAAESAAAGTSVSAKTIKIYDPVQDPELYDITFFSEAKFDSWLGRGFITGLFKEGQAPAIIYYDDLEDNALYTLEMCSGIPTRIKSMEKAMSHLGSRREVELALAIAQDCGPSATVRPDLRIIKDSAGKHIAELDAVVDYDDAFIIGSHKTKVAGDSDIKNLRRKVDEIVVHHPPFQGKRIELAFMTEHADEGARQHLRDTAKVYNVRMFERNGRAISRVNCSRGMQGCRLI